MNSQDGRIRLVDLAPQRDLGDIDRHVEHVLQADEGCDLDFLTQRPYTAKAPV